MRGLCAPGRPRRRRRVSSGSRWLRRLLLSPARISCQAFPSTPSHPSEPAAPLAGARIPPRALAVLQESQHQTHPSVRCSPFTPGSSRARKNAQRLKNQNNPTKNKLFCPQVTILGAAGISKPIKHSCPTPGDPRAPKDKEQSRALVCP